MSKGKRFASGIKDGVPIGLGYLSISFTFGIMSVSSGLYPWEALLISMLCVTSAGQFAGISVMLAPGRYIEMLISQLTINIRYSIMSISLSQRVSKSFAGIWRWIFSFMVTDEIFAVAMTKDEVGRAYFAGLCIAPYIGWSMGTLSGALLGEVLPERLMNALGIAIYAMFIAIVIPEMKKSHPVILSVIIAGIISIIMRYTPILCKIPEGISISVCAIIAAGLAAYINPVKQ